MIRNGGRIVTVGLAEQMSAVHFKTFVLKEAKMIASRVTLGEFPRAIRLLEKGLLHPDTLITHQMTLSEVAAAFTRVDARSLKPQDRPGHPGRLSRPRRRPMPLISGTRDRLLGVFPPLFPQRMYSGPRVSQARKSAPCRSSVPKAAQTLGRNIRSAGTLCMYTGCAISRRAPSGRLRHARNRGIHGLLPVVHHRIDIAEAGLSPRLGTNQVVGQVGLVRSSRTACTLSGSSTE